MAKTKSDSGYDAKAHEGRFSGSKLECPRSMVLQAMGYKPEISKKLEDIFAEGREHDEQLKKEAAEEWGLDFIVPESSIARIKTPAGPAEVTVTPDGILPDEIVEFKSLSASNYNMMNNAGDLQATPLFRKYYNQAQFYAGVFDKDKIRFRVRNKKNHKTKDIMVPFDQDHYSDLVDMVKQAWMHLKEGSLPPCECSEEEKKFCRVERHCRALAVADYEKMPRREIQAGTRATLRELARDSRRLKSEIDDKSALRDEITSKLKKIMREHGQREVTEGKFFVKYGIRWKSEKDKEDIEKCIEEGLIKTRDVPEEYLTVEEDDK